MLYEVITKGAKDKDYLRVREQISAELMTIRFTAKMVEKLCDTLRGQRNNFV